MEDTVQHLQSKLRIKHAVKPHEKVNVLIKKTVQGKIDEIDAIPDEKIIEQTDGILGDEILNEVHVQDKLRVIDKQTTSFDREATLKKLFEHRNNPSKKANDKDKQEELEGSKEIIKKKASNLTRKTKIIIEDDDEDDKELEIAAKPTNRQRTTQKATKGVTVLGPEFPLIIGSENISLRLPRKKETVNIMKDSYYMNNREIFVNFINALFEPYKEEIKKDAKLLTCETLKNESTDFALLTHQKIVRDYLNLYTPYRGLLLYHGLGSGKTCSSIAIAEGMKTHRKVLTLTPASLRMNYIEELKKCGDELYKKNQFWEWTPTDGNTDTVNVLSTALQLPVEYIREKKGAWLVNIKKKSNYDELIARDRKSLNDQINRMIEHKYSFISYNGLRKEKFQEMTLDYTQNIFDNKIIIIDEAHNLISRIANRIKKQKPIPENAKGEKDHLPFSLSMKIYEMLLSAKNARIVMLTGTPVINYPNEFGILFNILRGYIKTWYYNLNVKTSKKIDLKALQEIFVSNKYMDYIDYSPSTKLLTITRNPFGFKNKVKKQEGYKGVSNVNRDSKVFEDTEISDQEFENNIIAMLRKNDIEISNQGIKIRNKKALPDLLDDFNNNYIDFETKALKNSNALKRRIVGLSSYFKNAHESLLPKYEKKIGTDYHVVRIPMSDFQFNKYEEVRQQEREVEKKSNSKKGSRGQAELYEESSSTYKIFSRLFCNYVLPDRPMPIKLKSDQIADYMVQQQLRIDRSDDDVNENDEDDDDEIIGDKTYSQRIVTSLEKLKKEAHTYLSKDGDLGNYSPKFLHILENILDENNQGLHLLYSQFRTIEGIGIFSMVLEEHGFARFKIIKNSNGIWNLNMDPEDYIKDADSIPTTKLKPTFAFYTGTESSEEKEIIRNIYNGSWKYVPPTIAMKLREIAEDNKMGEVIKVLMITSAGSEGINLENTRFVHIMEPYWHPVRTEQVIGRARRICSHQHLPKELQTVEVFIYIMIFTEEQVKSDIAVELRRHDLSKTPPRVPVTTDQYLHELSEIKASVTTQLTDTIKQAAFDCYIYDNGNCFNFSNPSNSKFSYVPDYSEQKNDSTLQTNARKINLQVKPITILGVERVYYRVNDSLLNIYDKESYENALRDPTQNPVQIGVIEINAKGIKTFKQL